MNIMFIPCVKIATANSLYALHDVTKSDILIVNYVIITYFGGTHERKDKPVCKRNI